MEQLNKKSDDECFEILRALEEDDELEYLQSLVEDSENLHVKHADYEEVN